MCSCTRTCKRKYTACIKGKAIRWVGGGGETPLGGGGGGGVLKERLQTRTLSYTIFWQKK